MSQPYPGLRPYLESESDIFFGQDPALQALLERLTSEHFVTLLGLSGCGKSSLLNAGLLANIRPRVLDGGDRPRWLIAVLKPGSDPVGHLAAELEKLFPALAVRAEIEADSSGLGRLVNRAGLDPRQRVLIVVDQFEELFRYRRAEGSAGAEDKAAYFVKLLLQTRRDEASQVYVLLAMRSEFLGDCATFYGLAEQVNYGTFLLPKLTRDEMEETITGPLDDQKIGIEQELVQLVLNETEDQEDGLPLLQHAMRRTWEIWLRRNQPDTPISMADFRTFISPPPAGDSLVKHHLNDHLDSIYRALTTTQQPVTERLFRLLSERDARARVIRRPLPYEELTAQAGAEVAAVIEAFRDARLGRTFLMPPAPEELAGATVDISHECLLRRWDLLRSWVEAEARDARLFNLIAEEADEARREELATGSRKPLAGATLETYQAWRNQAQPSPGWARRYEGAFDTELQRPLRQFTAAMEYLDWSVASRQAEEARSSELQLELERSKRVEAENQLLIANLQAKKQKLKVQRAGAIALVITLLIVLFLVWERLSLQRETAVTIDRTRQNNDAVKDTSETIRAYAASELKRLDETPNAGPDFARTREVLKGVIALANKVTTQSEAGDGILIGKAAPAPDIQQEGCLFLGILDETGRDWDANSASTWITFKPALTKDKPIVEQLPGRQIVITAYNNLREQADPERHSQAAVIQVLQPNTKVEVESFDVGAHKTVWAKVRVVP